MMIIRINDGFTYRHIPTVDTKTQIRVTKNGQIIFSYPLTKDAEALISDFLNKLAESGLLQRTSKNKGISGVVGILSKENKLTFNINALGTLFKISSVQCSVFRYVANI